MKSSLPILAVTLLVPALSTAQQITSPAQIVSLGTLQRAAVDADPRSRQIELLDMQSSLRQQNLALRMPTVSFDGLAQYQSDVPTSPLLLPGGQPIFSAPRATYDSSARIEQRLFDPTRGPQVALERAQLAEQQARVRTATYALRQQVNDAFFNALMLQERAAAERATIAALEGRLADTNARVREGAAISAEAAAVEAMLLERRLDVDQLDADREAALSRLSRLSGRQIDGTIELMMPELAEPLARARAQTSATGRPEFAQFGESRERIERQRDLVSAQQRPRVSAFARGGYGKPGLNFIEDRFDMYGLIGLQVQWHPITWGSDARERDALAVQERIVATEESAFAKGIVDALPADLATIDRLQRSTATDARIVELREEVERAARVRLNEGAVSASDYLDRQSELLQARIAQTARRVDLARASARVLALLGVEIP